MAKKTRKNKAPKNVLVEPVNFSIDISEICDILGVEVKKNMASLGVDVAQKRTGLCILRTDETKLFMDDLFLVDIKGVGKGNLHNKLLEYYKKAAEVVSRLSADKRYEATQKVVIIEDCWMGQSVWTTKVLAKFATMSFVTFMKWTKNVPDPIGPDVARRRVGFEQDRGEFNFQTYTVDGETKRKKVWKRKPLQVKDQVKNFLEDELNLTIEDDNLADAFILSLAGLVDVQTL
jgi:hypothetical protein